MRAKVHIRSGWCNLSAEVEEGTGYSPTQGLVRRYRDLPLERVAIYYYSGSSRAVVGLRHVLPLPVAHFSGLQRDYNSIFNLHWPPEIHHFLPRATPIVGRSW